MTYQFNRRGFLQLSAAGLAGIALSRGAAGAVDSNGKLRLASIGTGGKGKDDLQQIAKSPRVEVVALCNVDDSKEHFGWAVEAFPKAEKFRDYRKLLDQADAFDAVCVSTPDHMHAPIALAAMALGKHCFCQKPLTHTVHEARLMRETAKKHKLVTQMGNQIQSDSAYRTAVKAVHDGVIGQVKQVHSWQAGDMGWLISPTRPAGSDPIPKTLDWDLWLGVAPELPYKNGLYHPHSWRAWQDFSTGQLGDFGCHILDPVFMALELTSPTSIEADAPPLNNDTWAPRSTVEYQFPGTSRTVGESIKVTWYDGKDHKPAVEGLGLPEKYELPHAGSVLVGEKGSMVIPHWAMPRVFASDKAEKVNVAKQESVDHYTSWAHACLGDGGTTSNFDYAAPLAEAVLLGGIAIRFPKEQLQWDAEAAEFTHHADANGHLTKEYRRGWELPRV